MRILILKDKAIPQNKMESAVSKMLNYYIQRGIAPEIFYEEKDWSNLPYSDYYAGNYGIDKTFIAGVCKDIAKRWSNEVDLVMFSVHPDNWEPARLSNIWGWNISKIFSGYEVEQCRFDMISEPNSIGTMYHEIMHSHDSFIYRMTGVRVEPVLNLSIGWDHEVVHGNHNKYKYIRFNENLEALSAISTFLKLSFQKRIDMFKKEISLYKQLIQVAQQTAELYRSLIIAYQKKDLPIYAGNVCECNKH